jgi:hypothetical protein
MAKSSSSSAHTAGAASTGAASVGAASAGAASTLAANAGAASAGTASAGAASARPVSAPGEQAASAAADVKLPSRLSAAALSAAKPAGKQNPAQMKAAYSLQPTAACWTNFRRWCGLRSGYRWSAMMSSTTSSPTGHPSLPNSGSWMARNWRRRRLNLSSWRRTTLFSALHISLVQPLTHGEEGGQELQAVRGFPAAEPGYRARCVPASQHAGLRRQGGGLHGLLQDRPEEGVPPDPRQMYRRLPSPRPSACSSISGCLLV